MTRETPPDSEAGPEASKPGADEERFATAPGLDAAEFLISALDATGELILVRGRGGRVVHVNAAFIAASCRMAAVSSRSGAMSVRAARRMPIWKPRSAPSPCSLRP